MKHILFIFLDGVGLGAPDMATNPLAGADIPVLTGLLGGRKPLAGVPRLESERALFIPTDAGLGVAGLPQSATGQATILTGRNVPRPGRQRQIAQALGLTPQEFADTAAARTSSS